MTAADALRFAARIERACSRTLADALVGVFLHGSLTLGDYVTGRSDVDLLAVVEGPPSDADSAALAQAIAAEGPRVDLRVVSRSVAAAPTLTPRLDLGLVLESGSVKVDAHGRDEPDLIVELSVCRAHGRSLTGPTPPEVIGDVPDEWVLAVGDAHLARWQRLDYDPSYAELLVFTACRAWRFAEERRHCSKSAAAEWALGRDSTLKVVRDVLLRRHSDPMIRIDEDPVRDLLALARARLAPRLLGA